VNQRGSREIDWVDGNSTFPGGDLPEASSAPAMHSPRLHGGEALQVRGSGEGKNGRQERLQEGDSVFKLKPWPRCTVQLVGRDWRAWAVFLDGVVHQV
jgi:hypothetical protein